MSVKERLKTYLKYKGVNASVFGRTIGVSSAFISSMRVSIQPDKVESIALNYPDLSIEWLLTGKGDMLIDVGNDLVSEPQAKYSKGDKLDQKTILSIIESTDRKMEKLIEISDRNSRSIEKMVDGNYKLIDLLHRNGIAVPADALEFQKGAPYTTVEGKAELTDEKATSK